MMNKYIRSFIFFVVTALLVSAEIENRVLFAQTRYLNLKKAVLLNSDSNSEVEVVASVAITLDIEVNIPNESVIALNKWMESLDLSTAGGLPVIAELHPGIIITRKTGESLFLHRVDPQEMEEYIENVENIVTIVPVRSCGNGVFEILNYNKMQAVIPSNEVSNILSKLWASKTDKILKK